MCGWTKSSNNKKVKSCRRQAKINQTYFKLNQGGSCFLVEYRAKLVGFLSIRLYLVSIDNHVFVLLFEVLFMIVHSIACMAREK